MQIKEVEQTDSLERETSKQFYVIETEDEQGIRKYISKDYSCLWQRTVKLTKAEQFSTKEDAETFIKDFSDYEKYPMRKPKIKLVKQSLCIIEEPDC